MTELPLAVQINVVLFLALLLGALAMLVLWALHRYLARTLPSLTPNETPADRPLGLLHRVAMFLVVVDGSGTITVLVAEDGREETALALALVAVRGLGLVFVTMLVLDDSVRVARLIRAHRAHRHTLVQVTERD